jgi:membrane protein DedA with SNARE-associated domain
MSGHWLPIAHLHLQALYHLPLAGLVSLDTLRNALGTLGYPAVALFIMIESSGIPFPGETMLLLASFYAAVDHQLQIPLVIACASLGAIIGDNLGYTIGRTGGYALVRRFGRYVFLKEEHLRRAERFFQKHGDKTVFFGRFIAVLRAWAAFLAGVNRMRWPAFLVYNAAGGVLWAIVYGYLGFFAGRAFHDNFGAVEHLAGTISWVGAGLLVAAIILFFIFLRMRRRQATRAYTARDATETISIAPTADSETRAAAAPAPSLPAPLGELLPIGSTAREAPEPTGPAPVPPAEPGPGGSPILAPDSQQVHAQLQPEIL